MTTRDIQHHVEERYGIEVSASRVSAVTDAVACFDALRVKLRAKGVVRNKAVYLAIGLCCSGHKASLGLWLEQTRGATFWLKVMNALKQRGTQGHPGGGR